MSQNTPITTIPVDDIETSPCVDRLCQIAGRDRAVAVRLREQAAQLLKMAEALEINSTIGSRAAAELIGEE